LGLAHHAGTTGPADPAQRWPGQDPLHRPGAGHACGGGIALCAGAMRERRPMSGGSTSSRTAWLLAAAFALAACHHGNEEATSAQVIRTQSFAADTARTGTCIRAALIRMVPAPDSAKAALIQCWKAA